MNWLRTAFAGFVGLLFDDGRLALGIVVLLALTGVAARTGALHTWGAIALLVGGTVALLLANVVNTVRRPDPRR
jgi:hypothetical protein